MTDGSDVIMADDNSEDPALRMLNEISHCYDLSYAQGIGENQDERWYDDTRGGATRQKVHVAETVVTVLVKDINDNAPVFPNATMFGKVRENGEPGLPVAVVGAWDADDATEGTNARLTYAIEKNVIQEETGEAIFTVEPLTGEVTTALCCLDRETTPEYSIQVVASDGGGLKGTGTVVVVVTDVNDNSPRLARQLWQAEVNETWGLRPPNANQTLMEISVSDQDTSNLFFYRIVEGSGLGWDHFGVRAEGGVGQLFARKTLDYENDAHRDQGFRFLVQVTDQGEGSWDDPAHIDSAWVVITLRDLNDNPPQFSRPQAHITLREDMAPGTILASFPALDFDMGGHQPVSYHVEGGRGALTVDSEGRVSLLRQLDREAATDDSGRGGGASVVAALVVAVDSGLPPAPLSATATLSITLEDVNDCPPRLLPPTTLRVREGAPAATLGTLTATDDDVWAHGHGPPFNFSLAPSNPAHVKAAVRLIFDQRIDSGRGGAEVQTLGKLDREEHRQLKVGVLLSDAGGLSAVHALTIIIDDINDNPMRPAAKTVYLWKTQGLGSEAPLGRVYVDDPDDWDGRDKEYAWAGHPHPLFTLHPSTGHIVASGQLREGRYDLHFSVSDRKWAQRGVGANVTVLVRFLTPEALAHATPLLLTPVTPMQLTKGWTPTEGNIRGGLGRLTAGVIRALGGQEAADIHDVEVVSVYGRDSEGPRIPPTYESSLTPTTCVWVSVRKEGGGYVDPIKLAGLLELHADELGSSMNLTMRVGDLRPPIESQDFPPRHDPLLTAHDHPSSATSLASTTLPLQVVDTNATALVTPRLTQSLDCRPRPHAHDDGSCTHSCLNGGRCVRQPFGNDRCICPGGSFGSRCKIPARTFKGKGWAWVAPLPPCLPASLSFKVLTNRPRGLLLYSGPLVTPTTSSRSLLALQLEGGRPRLLYEGRAGKVDLLVNTRVDDGAWHSIYAHFGTKGVVVMVDLCGRGWKDHDDPDDPRSSERNDHGSKEGHEHCLARALWRNPKDRTRKAETPSSSPWLGVAPLQIGGMAHTPSRPNMNDGRSVSKLVTEGLDGCVAHLTVNSQLVDLGEPPNSHASAPGCRPQEEACMGVLRESCGLRGTCTGGLKSPRCDCESGWTGDGCSTPTVPALLGASSYMKVALSFTPTAPPEEAGRAVGVQLRLRTRGARDGLLIQLSSHHRRATFSLHVSHRRS
ncbi:putative neural-cadherin 2 [Penaeus japonicus]|uniref:putative neural-cadherin 2 n=1 Tax=Penaeus japonicus TaxID=27405 RepID=UPI001C716378|nr:putative neural-cadherin 2 [Penaeus japonicus]